MPDYPESFDHMINAWNERDPDKIRHHLDLALADDVEFCDPQHHTHGKDEFEAMVRQFRADIPDADCARSTGIDTHHHLYRYAWTVSANGELLVPGFDVAAVNKDGKVCRVDGFFGPLPELAG
jgi:hypothetical protein